MATELAIPQAPAVSDMSRVDQAAILLMSLGEAEAAEILKHLGAKEVQRLGAAMAKLENVSREQASSVVTNFVNALEEQTSLGVGADDYVRRVLIGALGASSTASWSGRAARAWKR